MKNDGIWFIDLGKRKENSSLSNRKVVFLTELTGGEALEERGKGEGGEGKLKIRMRVKSLQEQGGAKQFLL